MEPTLVSFLPIFMQIAFAVVFVLATIFVSSLIGPKHWAKGKNANFECGLESIGGARSAFNVRYFLVAILFVVFDVEIVFMYPWALDFREFGLNGFLKMGGFVALLLVGYLYVIHKKALEWDPVNKI